MRILRVWNKRKQKPEIIVYPLYAEWVDRWNLWEIQRPKVNLSPSVADIYEEYGRL